MRKLLVPIDFSVTSAAALRYAVQLADAIEYQLEVIHVYDGFSETDPPVIEGRGSVTAQLSVQRQLDEFVRSHVPGSAGVEGHASQIVGVHAIIGAPPQTIVRLSKDTAVGLIVMGGVGASAPPARQFTYGSVARAVALRGEAPVLLIPKGYGVPEIRRMALAFGELAPLKLIAREVEFLRLALGLSVRFVHVRDDDALRESHLNDVLERDRKDTGFPDYPAPLDLLRPGELVDALSEYVASQQVDLLVLGRRQRSFFERLFVGSEVSPLLTTIPVPLLIVPIENYANY
ncbi:hypothetical protein LEM8419_01844 [Neolewinella maritima]|uniref:UspA domain-containing protein n=1 Tax=Neolewinella maritima TaxID=1383882 RepID=A0ABN8F7M5_9BACT|nr:universal stress protein [Neolewinella maritima]CAH1000710.1 hypothetical protein LEM8419_01844 [Neolewinella maritima]